ncbi:hypothetical protein [Corynebacterium ulceribovis]|uniref:hypothetical protein n=1 Tax=Corynebacterium ulceribovis TaxID=487732 RepID=UPI0003804727|nr:hypothetical protein [Corynebacterium ulceribovis]
MALEKFHFTTADGVEIVVPFYLDAIKRKHIKKIKQLMKEAGSPTDADDDVLFEYANLDEKTLDQIDELSGRDYMKFMEGWMEESKLGESAAS